MDFAFLELSVQISTEPGKDGFYEALVYIVGDMPPFLSPDSISSEYRGLSRDPGSAVKYALDELNKKIGPNITVSIKSVQKAG